LSSTWKQDYYELKNPKKYIGKNSPFFRSSWEERWMYYCDHNTNVVRWASELVNIPYLYEIENKKRTYITDGYMEVLDKNGKIQKYIVEIKPEKQGPILTERGFDYSNKPKEPKRKTKKSVENYQYAMKKYVENKNKWESAIKYCNKKGYKFVLINKKDLNLL